MILNLARMYQHLECPYCYTRPVGKVMQRGLGDIVAICSNRHVWSTTSEPPQPGDRKILYDMLDQM